MLTKDSILENLDQRYWGATAMNAVIASKAEKRAQKGQALHMYTLDMHPSEGLDEDSPEYQAFVEHIATQIHQVASNSDQPIRIQLAVRSSERHWTALDMEVSKDKVQFLLMDAANDSTGFITMHLFNKLQQKYPLDKQPQSRFYCLKHAPLANSDGSMLPQSIQFATEGCKYFALDNLFHSANMDPFPLLHERENQFENADCFYSFNAENMPQELGFVYKNTQSKRSFNSLPEHLKERVINKKGQTLKQAEEAHSREGRVKGEVKQLNHSIEDKRVGFINDTKLFIERVDDNDVGNLVDERSLLIAFERNKFLSHANYSPKVVAENLVKEAKILDKRHRPCMSCLLSNTAIKSAEKQVSKGAYLEAIRALEGNTSATFDYRARIKTIREKLTSEEHVVNECSPLIPKNTK